MGTGTGWLEAAPGIKSSKRAFSFISLLAAIMFGVLEWKSGANPPMLTLYFLGATGALSIGGSALEKRRQSDAA